MKSFIILSFLLMSGCGSTPDLQTLPEATKVLSEHIEKANLSKVFCEGTGLHSYWEGMNYYSFKCKNGGYFTLRKR